MEYILELKLRDTRKSFEREDARDKAYEKVLEKLTELGVPEDNIILSKIDAKLSDFTGRMEEKIVGGI